MVASAFCRRSVSPASGTTHLGHLVAVEAQGQAGTVVVQVARARQAQGAGEQGLLSATLPPGRTGRLQALAWGLLLAPLPWRALGTQGVGSAGQQARLVPTPHLGQARTRDRRRDTQKKTHRHTRAPRRRERRGWGQQGPGCPAPPRSPRTNSEPEWTPTRAGVVRRRTRPRRAPAGSSGSLSRAGFPNYTMKARACLWPSGPTGQGTAG